MELRGRSICGVWSSSKSVAEISPFLRYFGLLQLQLHLPCGAEPAAPRSLSSSSTWVTSEAVAEVTGFTRSLASVTRAQKRRAPLGVPGAGPDGFGWRCGLFGRRRGCARATGSHGAAAEVAGSGAADTELSRGSTGERVQVRMRPRGEKGTFLKFILKQVIETV